MVSLEGGWHSNPLRVVAMMTDTACEERAAEVRSVHPLSNVDLIWALMRQNQLMQEENSFLRKKMRSLQEENVWASSELDRIHWEHQTALVEIQWLYKQRVSVWTPATTTTPNAAAPVPAQPLPSPPEGGVKTYAETLQTDDIAAGSTSGERCIRHEASARRERRQCKCCVLEAIYRLVLSAPPGVQDVGEYVASSLVNIPPFANFWCPECTRDFVNQTPRRELESIMHLVGMIERDVAPMSELKRRLKPLSLRQRVKCAAHFKA